MEIITKQRINREVRDKFKAHDDEIKKVGCIEFIVERFFHYVILALLHGYKIYVNKVLNICLVYKYYEYVPLALRKSVRFSSKAFGYQFFVKVESKYLTKYNYVFRTDRKLINMITDYAEGDVIYNMIRK